MSNESSTRLPRTRSLIALLLASSCLPVAGAEAEGGTYDVVFCNSANRSFGGEIETTNAFTARSNCSDPAEDNAIKIANIARTTEGRSARVSWQVEPPLSIVGVSVEGRLRRADGYASRLFMTDAEGRFTHEVANGSRDPSDFETFEWSGAKPQQGFTASLECTQTPSCEASDQAHTWVRNLRFEVADGADPEVEVDGTLYDTPGWQRGETTGRITGTDSGSGIAALVVTVNSAVLVAQDSNCEGSLPKDSSSTFQPCPQSDLTAHTGPTNSAPFKDGSNVVRSCVTDFSGNETCAEDEVRVDNLVPSGDFAQPDPEDPELIRVPIQDDHSGIAAGTIFFRAEGTTDWRALTTQQFPGELRARVDSASEPPGRYEFMATASDVAGNSTEITHYADGTPVILDFPLRAGVQLGAHIEPGGSERTTLNYGENARAEGRLLDAAGFALEGKEVVVTESFGQGALIDTRVRTVVTDASGRFSSKLPAGPSRDVSVSYEGDQRYLSQDAVAGSLAVKTGAKLGLSRKRVPEGSATTFRGRVERLGARIPSRGKVLQLQYQEPASGRWFTVRNPFHTRSDGRFRFKYEFGTHYTTNVAIRFRLKVPPERGWPYKGTRTRPERVIVEARG